MEIKLLGLKKEDMRRNEKFFIFSFDEDDFVIAINKEKMKKYLLENRIDPEDIDEDFNPNSDTDVFFYNPNWDYRENAKIADVLEDFGNDEIIELR